MPPRILSLPRTVMPVFIATGAATSTNTSGVTPKLAEGTSVNVDPKTFALHHPTSAPTCEVAMKPVPSARTRSPAGPCSPPSSAASSVAPLEGVGLDAEPAFVDDAELVAPTRAPDDEGPAGAEPPAGAA